MNASYQERPVNTPSYQEKPVNSSYHDRSVNSPAQEKPANTSSPQETYQNKPTNSPPQESPAPTTPPAIRSPPPKRSPPSTAPPETPSATPGHSKMAALLALFEKPSDSRPPTQSSPPSEPKRPSPPAETPSETPAPASSIGRLMERFATQPQETPRHGLPRRQSLGGVSVRDRAAKHEKSEVFTKEAQRQAPKMGRVKPVTMQEISCPTIQEEREASTPAETRSSLENMMDELLEIDDAALEEEAQGRLGRRLALA